VRDVWNWLVKQWQDVRGNVKFWISTVVAAGAVAAIAALVHGLSFWQDVALIFLFSVILVWAVIASVYLAPRKPESSAITPENVEPAIRAWLDAFGLGTRKLTESAMHFAYEVRTHTGIPVAVLRTRGHPHYITLISKIEMAAGHKVVFDRLTEPEKAEFGRKLVLEAAKAKIAYETDATFEKLTIEKRIPITAELAEANLIDGIGEITFAALVMIATIAQSLESRAA